MNEITPHGLGRGALRKSSTDRKERPSARRSSAARGARVMRGTTGANLLAGLRIVLHECDRRAAVMRTLTSVRWLAQRGAEVVLFDGTASGPSADGLAEAVAKHFPFVVVAEPPRSGSVQGLVNLAAAPLSIDGPAPRWVLALRADLDVDRFGLQGLLREVDSLPEGSLLVPGVIGPDGRPSLSRRAPSAWIARRSDLSVRPFDQLTVRSSSIGPVLRSSRSSFAAPSLVHGR